MSEGQRPILPRNITRFARPLSQAEQFAKREMKTSPDLKTQWKQSESAKRSVMTKIGDVIDIVKPKHSWEARSRSYSRQEEAKNARIAEKDRRDQIPVVEPYYNQDFVMDYYKITEMLSRVNIKFPKSERRKDFKKIDTQLQQYFPDSLQRAHVLQSELSFLDSVLSQIDPKLTSDSSSPIFLLNFVTGFPSNIVDKLKNGTSVELVDKVLRIGEIAAAKVAEFTTRQPDYKYDSIYKLAKIVNLISQDIPFIIGIAGTNQEKMITLLEEAAAGENSLFKFADTVGTYRVIAENARQFINPDSVFSSAIQLRENFREISSDNTDHQFGEVQMKSIINTAFAIVNAFPQVQPENVISAIGNEVSSQIKLLNQFENISGQFVLSHIFSIIENTTTQAIKLHKLTPENFNQLIHDVTITTSRLILKLNAGRKGKQQTYEQLLESLEQAPSREAGIQLIVEDYKQEAEETDWIFISRGLNAGLVEHLMQMNELTENKITIPELIGWLRGKRQGLNDEIRRVEAIFSYANAISDIATRQGLKKDQIAQIVSYTARAMNEYPLVIEERGFNLGENLSKQENIPAPELANALIAAQRGINEVFNEQKRRIEETEDGNQVGNIIDHDSVRKETKMGQLDRGFAFALEVPIIGEHVIRQFALNEREAVQLTRGIALIQDAFTDSNSFRLEEAVPKMHELLNKFNNRQSLQDFLQGLTNFIYRYDNLQNTSERTLQFDGLKFIISSPHPEITLNKILQGPDTSLLAAGWYERIIALDKKQAELIAKEPPLDILIANGIVPLSVENRKNAKKKAIGEILESISPLGIAMRSYVGTFSSENHGIQEAAKRLGRLRLTTVEEAKTVLPVVMTALSEYFHIPIEELKSRIPQIIDAADYIDIKTSDNPLKNWVASTEAVFGAGLVPTLVMLNSRTIAVNEKGSGFDIAAMGEEVTHIIRERKYPEGLYTSVAEFYGHLGKRIMHKILGLPDIKEKPEKWAKKINKEQEDIMGQSIFHYLDSSVGFEKELRSTYEHMIGYVAASNISLNKLPENILTMTDEQVGTEILRVYGPKKSWYEKEKARIRQLKKPFSKSEEGNKNTEELPEVRVMLEMINNLEQGLLSSKKEQNLDKSA